jgi:hypothetical protein
VLELSRPVTVSRRLTGVPAARLADSWRMRRSPPEQGTAHGTEVIDTTSNHLFWVPATHTWV